MMMLKKKSNHNVKHVLIDYKGKQNIHLLTQSNFPEAMKNNKKKLFNLEKGHCLSSLSLYGQFYEKVTMLRPAPNNSLPYFFLSQVFKTAVVSHQIGRAHV